MADAVVAPVADTPVISTETMRGFLEGTEPESEPTEATNEETVDEESDVEPAAAEGSAEPSDDDEEAEESEEAAKAAPEDKEATEKKKSSRHQRLKAQRDQALTDAATHQKRTHEAVHLGFQWRSEALALRQELQRIVKVTGYKVDPRDVELFTARRTAEAREISEASQRTIQEVDKSLTENQTRAALKEQYREQADGLAQKHGLERNDVLLAYANTLDAGKNLTMEQVAANLGRALGKAPAARTPQQAQLAANRAAPQTMKPGKAPAPKYKNTTDDMKAFLTSKG